MVSVLIPAYKEARILPDTVARLIAELEGAEPAFEILICDDGSADETAAVVAALQDPRVQCVTGAHTGKGGALARGVAAAKGELIFYTDADLAYGTAVIPRFLHALRQGEAEIVIGSRPLHKQGYAGYSRLRRVLSRGYQACLRHFGGIAAGDPQCGCKAYTARAAKQLFAGLTETGFAFEFETLLRAKKAGLAVLELPVRVLANGTSHVRPLRDGVTMLRAARKLRRIYK